MLSSPWAVLNKAHQFPYAKEMASRLGTLFPTVPQKQTSLVNFELSLLGIFYDSERLVLSED